MELTKIIEEATELRRGNGPATSWSRERKLADLVIALAEHIQDLKALVTVLEKLC